MAKVISINSKFAFVRVPGNPPERSVGCVYYNQRGYYTTTYTPQTQEEATSIVRAMNEPRGITPEVELAMLHGSMFGWNVPGAKPAHDYFKQKA